MNLYAYCANNPVMYEDPSGYCKGKDALDGAGKADYYINPEGTAIKEKHWDVYKNFDDMIANGEKPINGTLSDVEARIWYLSNEEKIASKIDTRLSLEGQAQQAFELRNSLRTQTRNAMVNRVEAEKLMKNDPNMTWDQIMERYAKRGKTGDDLFQAIVDSSKRSRPSVNGGLLQ